MNFSTHNEDARFLELLQKWQSGDFTRADEQEMRALAVDDEFRQEALEGFQDFPALDHAISIQRLQEKLRNKHPHRSIAFPQLWALAAAIALVFGAIWFFNIRPVPQDIAQVSKELSTPTDMEQPAAERPVATTPPESAPRLDRIPQPPARSGSDKDIAASESFSKTATADDKKMEKEQSSMAAAPERAISEPVQSPGVVVDQSTNMALPKEIAEEAASRSKKSKAPAKSTPVPVYEEAKADKKVAAGKSAPGAQPTVGWEAFRQYLNANAKLTPGALANNVSGMVRLQFRVNEKNQPVDFKVVQSLGYGCDEAAIQLIKGVSWLHLSDQAIAVDVSFVR